MPAMCSHRPYHDFYGHSETVFTKLNAFFYKVPQSRCFPKAIEKQLKYTLKSTSYNDAGASLNILQLRTLHFPSL